MHAAASNPLRSLALTLLLAACVGCFPFPVNRDVPQEGAMDNARLQELIESVSSEIEGQLGYWAFSIDGRQIVVITDENADRMRVMTAVAEDENLTTDEVRVLLEANFDRALDARYAVARGYLWSVFIHPLSTLTDDQFIDAVRQVATLADNTGSTYSSTDLVFQGGQN